MAKKVLLIDDDLYIRDLYAEVLTGEGFEVTTAQDGEEGLNKILEGGYGLILLDVMMPKLDGLGVLSALADKSLKNTNGPIILLTNLQSDADVKAALDHGAKAFFVKSDHTPEEFVNEVKKYLA